MFLRGLLILIGIVIVIFVLSIFGLHETITQLTHVRIDILVLAALVQLAAIGLLICKLRFIASRYKPVSYTALTKIWFTGALLDLITPFIQIGGEPAKIYMFKKQKISLEKSTAIVAVDDLSELLVFMITILISVVLLLITQTLATAIVVGLIAGLLITVGFVSLFFVSVTKMAWSLKLAKAIYRMGNKIGFKATNPQKRVRTFHKTFQTMLNDGNMMFGLLFLSVGAKFLEFIRIWLVFYALGIFIPLQIVVFVWTILLLLGMLPGLPGNLGIIEAGGISAYVLFGVPQAIAGASVILDRILSFWFVLFAGIVTVGSVSILKNSKRKKGFNNRQSK